MQQQQQQSLALPLPPPSHHQQQSPSTLLQPVARKFHGSGSSSKKDSHSSGSNKRLIDPLASSATKSGSLSSSSMSSSRQGAPMHRASSWLSSLLFAANFGSGTESKHTVAAFKSEQTSMEVVGKGVESNTGSESELKENESMKMNVDAPTKLDENQSPSKKNLAAEPMDSSSAKRRKDDSSTGATEISNKAPIAAPPRIQSYDRSRSVAVAASTRGLSLGASTHIGGKPENQDISFCIGLKTGFDSAIAVFDGHGRFGGQIAKKVHDFFIRRVVDVLAPTSAGAETPLPAESDLHARFVKDFLEIENIICANQKMAENSGTTATIAIQKAGRLFLASTGDSRAVLGSAVKSGGNNIIARRLTTDHRFEEESEYEMVTSAGGIVRTREGKQDGALRVWLSEEKAREFGLRYPAPGLMVSRSVGDYLAKVAGCSARPDVVSFSVVEEDRFLIVASDGLWDVMTDEEAVQIVHEFDHPRDAAWAKVCAEKLINVALRKGREMQLRTDNITVAIMHLERMFL